MQPQSFRAIVLVAASWCSLPLMLSNAVAAAPLPPLPTPAQVRMLDNGLSQFMHFSVNPYSNIEHNCVGTSGDCIPASVFNPTNLSTDQWVQAAVAFGADEICLTAHHEGGFCLWDTKCVCVRACVFVVVCVCVRASRAGIAICAQNERSRSRERRWLHAHQ
jgi:hypothetical protein